LRPRARVNKLIQAHTFSSLKLFTPSSHHFCRSPSIQVVILSAKKLSDIVISPHNTRTQPVIQSAPAHQGGRFQPMALPSLPKVQQPPGSRRILGNVPMTPTRLTLRSNLAASASLPAVRVFNIRSMKEWAILCGHKKEVCCMFCLPPHVPKI
jgi:hypothetical protein